MRQSVAFAVFAGFLLSLGAVGPAHAKAYQGETTAKEETTAQKVLYGTGSVLTSIVYCPVKTIYSIGGHAVGGVAYILTGGNKQTSRRIFDNAVKGDYFVLPSHLKGEKQLRFVGGSE
jgi:outer membrane lipoprotein SlyB